MILAVCGPGRCGKDTVALWFNKHTTLRFHTSTSLAAAPYVFEKWGHDYYPDVESCFAHRGNYRETWRDLMVQLNTPDPTTVARLCMETQELLVGIRTLREYEPCREKIIDLSLWIEKPYLPPDLTLEYGPESCDLTVINDGSLKDLYTKLDRLARFANLTVSKHGHR